MKPWRAVTVLLLFLVPAFILRAEEVSPAASLDLLIKEALTNNPGIQAAYNEWKASEYKIIQASAFPDPMFGYASIGRPVETRLGPQEEKLSFSQKIPFPVKLALKRTAGIKQASIMNEKYEARRRELIKNVKLTYYDIYWVDKGIEISSDEKGVLERLESVARRKYESNLSPQQDVIKAQVELTRLDNDLYIFGQNKKSLGERMNSLLNRPSGTPLKIVTDIRPAPFDLELDKLHALSAVSRQDLISAELGVKKARIEKSMAEFDFVPDLTFGLDYIQIGKGYTNMRNDGDDAWMAMFSVNIPLWFDKLGAAVMEKEAALRASEENYSDVKNTVGYEIEDLYVKARTYYDIMMLYKTALLPQVDQSFEAARTGYESGKVDFLNWLESERMLLRTRLAYHRAIADYLKSVAELERKVGRDL